MLAIFTVKQWLVLLIVAQAAGAVFIISRIERRFKKIVHKLVKEMRDERD